ncbi:MAG TPA: SDR family NAD(P)-dependent oxidoreductase [Baekduia sp.]|uniref:SDR family NAD(P)-dependent oxidoreductase n=1 Tax=Baekduia sp. TaxID=2600305 RepID=UPI002C49A183|nr:SDR family NAD(P)-dependent oxidoreductase [Baekduia sp.]HMJ37528.1 SDR family NAD(P)-dependent oxidoreductase [Baekduia sp.]
MELRGSSVLLTGATGGIGHAIARQLHAAGASLLLTGRRADVLEPLAAEIGGRAMPVDLSDRGEVDRLLEDAGAVDVLVANAALPASGDILDFSVEQIDRALEVNLRAPMILSRVLGERMVERGSGHIVLISSLAGKSSQPSSSIYSATKFGLRGFGQGLRGDLGPRGVGVSVVFPGFIRDAGMFHESGAKLPKGVGTSTPEDVAAAVVRAITTDKGEIDVAPIGMRAGTTFASIAPTISAKVAKRLGGDKVGEQLAAGQANKR